MNHRLQHKTTTTNILYLSLKVKDRNKGNIKLPFSCRHIRMICAINCRWDSTHQEHMEIKQPFCLIMNRTYVMVIYWKIQNTLIVFYINFPYHCVLEQVDSDTDMLDNMVLRKEVVQPTKEPTLHPRNSINLGVNAHNCAHLTIISRLIQ